MSVIRTLKRPVCFSGFGLRPADSEYGLELRIGLGCHQTGYVCSVAAVQYTL